MLAALALKEFERFDGAAQAKRNLRAAIERVAARLGNTPTICRKCYVHPEVLNSYLDGSLASEIKAAIEDELRNRLAGLQPEEAAVLALLRTRLQQAVDEGSSLNAFMPDRKRNERTGAVNPREVRSDLAALQ